MTKDKPVGFGKVLYFCHIFNLDVDKEQCQGQCKVISKNIEVCCVKECRSPWRYCIACLRQGYKGHDNLATNPQKGLCGFHMSHGSNIYHPTGHNGDDPIKEKETIESHKVVGTVIEVAYNKIRPFKGQPRTYFNEAQLKSLELSIKVRGQIQPALVRALVGDPHHDFELIEGQCRWHVCTSLGRPLRVEVRKVTGVEDQFEQSIMANFQRADHSGSRVDS